MKYMLVLTMILTTAAFGTMDTHLEGDPNGSGVLIRTHSGSKDVIVDNLVTESGQIDCAHHMYGPNDWWIAVDWTPDNDYEWWDWSFHLITLGEHPFDLNVEVYNTDLNTDPIDSFTVPEGDITSTDSGFTAFGYTVYLCEMEVTCTVDFLEGGYYWIAHTFINATNEIFMVTRRDSIIDDEFYFYDGSEWYRCSDFFGHYGEGSYAIGGTPTAIESASLGEIKAAYK
ncbi:MAG: hypothetical protein GY771_17230 [bacterium]|nr:hypothetical protein [bacterium]